MTDHIDTAQEREKLAGLNGFTPGPWEFITGEYGYSCLVSDRNEEVLTVGGYNDGDYPIVWMGEDASPQDTLLIAAAPDLLATVHSLLDALDAKDAVIERLREERELAEKLSSKALDKDGAKSERIISAQARAEKAEAEVERLRAVLNDIYENVEYWNTLRISSKIRAALQRKEGNV